jgi:hypothetical protein
MAAAGTLIETVIGEQVLRLLRKTAAWLQD